MEPKKIYLVDDVEFHLNEDITHKQKKVIAKFFAAAKADGENINLGNFDHLLSGNEGLQNMNDFFQIALIPVNGKLPDNFSFENIKESVETEVVKDFFLSRIKRGLDMQKSFFGLTKDSALQSVN